MQSSRRIVSQIAKGTRLSWLRQLQHLQSGMLQVEIGIRLEGMREP